MINWKEYLLLQIIILNILGFSVGQWCGKYGRVTRTRVKWNNGQRMVSTRSFFGHIKYKYEPYIYTTIQYDTNYEYTNVCCDGYRKVSDTKCEPLCQPACPTNSHCRGPNECACNEDYDGDNDSALAITCSPICEVQCQGNYECTKPNTCTCAKGYEETWTGCKPLCSPECSDNTSCTKPNECTCNYGYSDNGWGSCQPICIDKCPENAICSKPDICTCLDGYEMIDNKCHPVCQSTCPENSICLKPNQCECLEGFQRTQEEETSLMKCLPKCDNECPLNSYCHKPNECFCNDGYLQNELGLCQPNCVPSCFENSICLEPNKCSCLTGYEMLDNHCKPICTKVCPENAFCKQPDKCECEPGYRLQLTSSYNLHCEPICQSNCSTFGQCVAPNKCECLEGYAMDEMEICQPVCSKGCQNGLCYKPNVCICKPGYLMGPQEQCEPTCSLHCQNGSCVEPEICQCHKGFRLKQDSINICEPICEPQCKNGICAGPNVCLCYENYEPMVNELGLNHNDCQLMSTTIEFDTTIEYETTTLKELELDGSSTTQQGFDHAFTSNSDIDLLINNANLTMGPAKVCSENCQCWQEYDEFGSLTTDKCTHVCLDDHDQPCLNLTLCKCDITKTQLICRSSDDSTEQDDPLRYMCKIQRFRATTSKPIDMKSIGESKNSIFLWVIISCLAIIGITAIVGAIAFYRFRQRRIPILEYEL